jgi:phytoene synthase
MSGGRVSAADVAAVRKVVAAAGTSFRRGMAVLPPARRQAMYAIYAFCRIVDDIADDPAPVETRLPRLRAWRQRIARLFAGEAEDALTRVLLDAIPRFGLRREDFEAVIAGMEMDAVPIVAPSAAELDLYCDRVAAAVGRLSVRVFGDASAEAGLVAHHLGRALQLTNILRDLDEDAERGRLYLPRELLQAAGVPLAPPEAALAHPNLAAAAAALAEQARRHFAAAAAAMDRCDRTAMRPARLMAASYAAILARLQKRGWRPPRRRVRVPTWEKLWIALCHWRG